VTKDGYDLELIRLVRAQVSVLSSQLAVRDISRISFPLSRPSPDAVLAASVFHSATSRSAR